MMKVISIEDNELDRLVLQKLIQQNDQLELIGEYESALAAISIIRSAKPDLIFLDIELPGMTGIEFINSLKEVPQIIFVTSHENYALDAFENDVTDFLLKPLEKKRFNIAVNRALKIQEWLSLESTDDRSVFIRVDRDDVKIFLKDIIYVEAMADYVKVHTTEDKYLVLSTMKSIATKLPEEEFVRIHRSFIVNINHIDSFNGSEVVINGLTIPVSRSCKKELKGAMSNAAKR